MTLEDLKNEAIRWRFTKYKLINLTIGLSALLFYEFVARPYYRPYIYAHKLYDFHIADTLLYLFQALRNPLANSTTILIWAMCE